MKSKILQELSKNRIEILNEFEAKELLKEHGIACSREVMVEYQEGKKGEEYLIDLKKRGMPQYPVFLKVVSRDIWSKTDARAMKKVESDKDAAEAIDGILKNAREYRRQARIQGILASEDVSGPEIREMFLGSIINPQFGHIVSLGFGGIFVEVYRDVEFRVVPLLESDVYSMIHHLKAKEILGEFRGTRPANLKSLVETAIKLSKMIEENPEIDVIDVNPILVSPEKSIVVDAKIKLSLA